MEHFITKFCAFVRSKKSIIHCDALLKTVTSSSCLGSHVLIFCLLIDALTVANIQLASVNTSQVLNRTYSTTSKSKKTARGERENSETKE